MRKDGIISKMKASVEPVGKGHRRRASLALPFTALNYHFSQRYIYTFLSRYPVEIFYQAYDLLVNFRRCWNPDKEDDGGCGNNGSRPVKKSTSALPELHSSFTTWDTGGSCALVVSLMALEKIEFDVEIPEQIIVVDTHTMKSDIVRRGKLVNQRGRTASDDEDDALLEELEERTDDGDAGKPENNEGGGVEQGMEVGRDDEETHADNAASKSTSTDQNDSENASSGEKERQTADEQPSRTTRVRFAHEDGTMSQSEMEANAPLIDIPARQASRINLALARNFRTDINIRDINPQDNIVVNACTIKISPKRPALTFDDVDDCCVINCQLQRKKKKSNNTLPVLSSAPLCHLSGRFGNAECDNSKDSCEGCALNTSKDKALVLILMVVM